MRPTAVLALALATITLPAVAQAQGNARVIKAMQGRWVPALCPLHNDFRTNGANTYLKSATEQPDTGKAHGLIRNAIKTASDAIAASPQNAAGYYYLGRAQLILGDIVGADSNFTKASTLSPDCEGELKGFRQTAWLALVMPSTDYLKAQNYDSAMSVLRAAQVISRDYPQGFFNMAVAFVQTNHPDSGVAYFKLAQELAIKGGNDPLFTTQRDRATMNLGMLYASAGKNKEAADEFKQYLTYQPNDVDAKKRLSDALRASGDVAGASQVNQALAASGDMSASDLVMMGISYFKETPPKYKEAADAFAQSLKKEPGQRDVLFNLANMYLALKDGPNLIATSLELMKVDPVNEDNYKLLANGYMFTKDQDKQLDAVVKMQAMVTTVKITKFVPRADGAKLTFTATGRPEAQDKNDKPIPPAAFTLVFECTNGKGEAVGTPAEVTIPALKPNESQEFSVDCSGAGVVAWRYHAK